ncbi:MAG: ABC transporter ATP-binding protein [Candidatus Eremiobacteraeota bacterium]|nr:ABC transporter ATP-binding protein [Candidatus Eremiobacteraeota bacterium]
MLEVRNLAVRYGERSALEDIAFAIGEGELVAILGANGAGKTTLFAALSGLVPSQGEIHFAGRDIRGLRTDRIIALGLTQCPEGRKLFPALSVERNLQLGSYVRRADRAGNEAAFERVCRLFPDLRSRLRQAAGSLSGGQQQMVAIGRALMARPRLLLLDEPFLGLAPKVVGATLAAIAEINGEGTTVLLGEQNAHAALSVARRAYVLQNGRIVLEGPATALRENEQVKRAFIGA